MPSFAQYEIVRELYRSGLYTVATARRAGTTDPEAFAVKECHASAGVLGESRAKAMVHAFLERAEVQRLAAAAGSHWAPIHEAGPSDEGASYATDLYPRSAQKLVVGRVKLDGKSLGLIVGSVLSGLLELRQAGGRAHGNLKPSNVLIAGTGDAPLVGAVLTDPADAGSEASGGPSTAGDLRALGELIHLLVLHQPLRAQTGWPLAQAPEWSRLGPSGAAWRELCNRLLDPALPSQTPTLEEIQAAMPAAKEGKRSKGLVWGGVALAVLALGGGAAILLVPRTPPPPPVQELSDEAWGKLCDEYDEWFAGLVARDPGRIKLVKDTFSGDPQLGEVLKALGADTTTHNLQKVTDGAGGDARDMKRSPPPSIRTNDGKRRVAAAADAVAKIKAVFSPEELPKWAAWDRARTLAEACKKRGWTGPQRYLENLTKIAVGPDLLKSVGEIRRVQDEGFFDAIARLAAAADDLAATGDKVLSTFPAVVAGDTALEPAQIADPEAVKKLVQSVTELDKQATQIRTFLASPEWKRVDKPLFEEEGPPYRELASAGPSAELLGKWLYSAQNNKDFWVPGGADPRDPPIWGPLEPIETSIAVLRDTYKKDPKEFQDGVDWAKATIEQLRALRWSAAKQPEINSGAAELKRRIADLTQDVKRRVAQEEGVANSSYEDLRRSLAERAEVVSEDSRAINKAWRDQRDALLAAAAKIPEVTARKESLVGAPKRVEEFLVELDKSFGAGIDLGAGRTRDWGGALAAAVGAERERALSAVLSAVDWPRVLSGDAPGTDAGAAERFKEWSATVANIAADMASVETAIDGLYPLDATVIGGRSAADVVAGWASDKVFADASIQAALAPVLVRIRDVAQVGMQSSWASLITTADGNRPALKMAAWRRLRTTEVSPPSIRQALEEEARIRKDLATGPVSAIRDEARRRELLDELSSKGEQWWGTQMARAASPDDIELAIAARGDAYQGRDDTLDPRVRYNLKIHELKAALAVAKGQTKPDQEKLKEAIEAFIASVVPLPVAGSEPASGFLAALRAMTSMEGPPPVDVRTLGPGSLPPGRVAATLLDDDTVGFKIMFTKPADRSQQTITLTFRRVKPASGPETFVSTQEVSVALFASIASEASAWADLGRQGKHIYDDEAIPQNDTRFGPRTWEPARGGAKTNNPIRPASQWLVSNPEVAGGIPPRNSPLLSPYPPGLDAGKPSWNSPVTWISPAAAIFVSRQVGCRLPTAAEWAAALDAERSGLDLPGFVSGRTPNLRDTTWALDKKYIDGLTVSPQNRNPMAPERGSFWVRVPDANAAQPYDDQTLWFWEVDHKPGTKFNDLVGNVAELVLNKPEDAEESDKLPTPAPLAECEAAAGNAWSRISVIGGSAQSPAEAKIDAPAPFTPSLDGPYYADVGFRLAFSASNTGGPTIMSMLAKELESPRYLPPR